MNASTSSKLHVMLDTNSLYSPHATNQFVAPALVEVIEDDAHKSLNINWVISEMVRSEREYHLRREARHVISAARKIPEVFSSTWVCDEDAVFAQVSNFAQRELDRLKVSVRGCDSGRVDWPSLIAAAGLRLPPFDPNLEKEKGFKDAIVAETFLQLCGDLPAHGSETAILVSDDTMLGDQVAKRVDGAKVKVLKDLDELRILGQRLQNCRVQLSASIHTDAGYRRTENTWIELYAADISSKRNATSPLRLSLSY
jgi:hypothetical protein